MLNKKKVCLLNAITKLCKLDAFVVIENSDILNSDETGILKNENLSVLMQNLASDGYIVLKYFSDGEYCLELTKKSFDRNLITANKKVVKKQKCNYKKFVFYSLANFVGTLCALLLIKLFGGLC